MNADFGPYKLRQNGRDLCDVYGRVYRCTGYDHALNLAIQYASRSSVYIINIRTGQLIKTVRPEDL